MVTALLFSCIAKAPAHTNWTLRGRVHRSAGLIQYFDHGRKIAVVDQLWPDRGGLLVLDSKGSRQEYDFPGKILNLGLSESGGGIDWWFAHYSATAQCDFYCLHLPGEKEPRRVFTSTLPLSNLVSIGYSPDRSEVMVNTLQGVWLWSRKTDTVRQVTGEAKDSPFHLLSYIGIGVLRWDSLTAIGSSVDEVLNSPKPIRINVDPEWEYRSMPTWIWKYSAYLGKAFSQDGKVLDLKTHESSEFQWHDPDKTHRAVDIPFVAVADAASTVVYGYYVDPRPSGGTGPPPSWTTTLYVIEGKSLKHVSTITTPEPGATGIALSPDGRHLAAVVGKDVLVTDIPEVGK